MRGKSPSNFRRLAGLSGGSINCAGGGTGGRHCTGVGFGEGDAQPASKVAATSVGSRQSLRQSTFNLLSSSVLPLQSLCKGRLALEAISGPLGSNRGAAGLPARPIGLPVH